MLHAGRTLACAWRQAHDERMHDRGVGLRTVCVGLGLGLAVLCAACTASVGHGSSAQAPAGGRPRAAYTGGGAFFFFRQLPPLLSFLAPTPPRASLPLRAPPSS